MMSLLRDFSVVAAGDAVKPPVQGTNAPATD